MDYKCHDVINGFKNIKRYDKLTMVKGSGLYSETREGDLTVYVSGTSK
jgi:hypothetical protein